MTTSLAAQLKKLAVPETRSVLSGDLKQASFLYDEKQAATFEKQHFYNIGVNGLQQLIEKDERFLEFENNLFSPSSQSLQRYIQTPDVNKKLDEVLEKFLLRLSPYMQLREAHKAMEWMVHRYNVHLRNVDALMMCVLPYHDQEPFIMALRLLKLDSNECAKWKWLEPVQKGGSFLSKHTLTTHCRAAKGFLGLLCQLLTRHIEANTGEEGIPSARHLQKVLTFYTQTVLGALVAAPPTESTLSILIPAVTSGLQSHDLPDHMMSSYMILSQMFTQTTLAQSLLESLMNVIAKNVQANLLPSAVAVLVIMFQKQNVSKVTKKSFKYLVRHPSLTQTLLAMSRETVTEPFLTPLMLMLTKRALKALGNSLTSDSNPEDNDEPSSPSLMAMLVDVLTQVTLDQKTVSVVARQVLGWFLKEDSAMEDDSYTIEHEGPFHIFRLLENKFPAVLDCVIKELSAERNSEQVLNVLNSLFERSMLAADRDLVSDPLSCMVICLHHRQGSVRKKAVERLLQDTSLMEDKASVQAALTIRLQDEDPGVVKAVLENPQHLWELFEDKTLLYNTLLKKLVAAGHKPGVNETRDLLLQCLCCVPPSAVSESQLTLVLLSYLVLRDETELQLARDLLNSPVAHSQHLLAHIRLSWLPVLGQHQDDEGLTVVFLKLVEAITQFIISNSHHTDDYLQCLYRSLDASPRPGSAALLLLHVYQRLIQEVERDQDKAVLQLQLAETLPDLMARKLMLLKTKKNTPLNLAQMSKEEIVQATLSHLVYQGCLPLSLLAALPAMLDLACVPQALKDCQFWVLPQSALTPESTWLKTVAVVINFLFELSTKPSSAVQEVAKWCFVKMTKIFESARELMKFLCMMMMSRDKDGVSCVQRARMLQFACVYVTSLTRAEKTLVMSDPTPVLPCLLMLLSSKFELVRKTALTIMGTLSSELPVEASCQWLVERLLSYKQEITQDQTFFSTILARVLVGEERKPSQASPKRKRNNSNLPAHTKTLNYLLHLLELSQTPALVKVGLLTALDKLDDVESFPSLLRVLGAVLKSRDQEAAVLTPEEQDMTALLLKHLTPATAVCITAEGLNVLLTALTCPMVAAGQTTQQLALHQLSSKFMAALPHPSRQSVFKELVNIVTDTRDADVARQCRKVVKHMTLESSLITDELQSVLCESSAGSIREVKRQKMHAGSVELELDCRPWQRIRHLFEMIQNKKKILQPVAIVPLAFRVLGRVLDVEDKGSGEYMKQLILGTISAICARSLQAEEHVKGEHLNMDLIVNCIRSSDNPHTHHQALLLLSSAAKIAPGLLLHNMMSVFTFMGTSILRQDDAYSFHVIGKILDNVIPALIMAAQEKSKDKPGLREKSVTKAQAAGCQDMLTVVLRVFVDAIPHIPSHRRLMLFEKLVSILGADSYLWRLVLLFIESVTVRGTLEEVHDVKNAGPLATTDLEFLTSLTEKFSSPQLLQCYQKAVDYMLRLPEEKLGTQVLQLDKASLNLEDMSVEEMEIFSVPYHSAKQLRHFKFATVFAVHHLVGSQHLVAQMAEAEPSLFLKGYQSLMETILRLIGQVTVSHDQHKDTSSARFWRILLNKSQDLMDSLVNLLPDSMFMEVVSGLMGHSLPLVQKRAIELLNTKLQHYKDNITSGQSKMLVTMAGRLKCIVHQSLVKGDKSKEEDLLIGQTGLYSLKVLCRILGAKNHKQFIEVLQVCVKVLTRHADKNGLVSASCMLCIAEIVSSTTVHTVQYLGDFMPLIIHHLQSKAITQNEVLLLAAVSSLQKMIETLALFLSPYLLSIFVQVCVIHSVVSSQPEAHRPTVSQKLKLICGTLATATPTRTFLPVLEKSFVQFKEQMASCAECALSMLKSHIVKMTRDDLTTFSSDLLKFFFFCFDLRVTHTEISAADLDVIEGCVIEAFISLVFKLSEAQFKPMLLQIYNWAVEEDVAKERVLFFYRLCDGLAGKLKNLFTLFAGHILKHSAQLLDGNHKMKKYNYFGKDKVARGKSCRLLLYVLDCLQKTFAHDTEGFLTKERFDVVMQPLVDQLENTLGKTSVCSTRITDHVIPCLASLAAAAQDDSLWKDLNYQILLKTRHENPQVKIWALSALDAFHKQLGEDYTQLVPETIPFMAELMEDESDEVEKQTQKVLAAMEISVGENLQEYF
ncbi:HEAT repeat-containing protein 1-like [Physella acuta]|uniref:HEAT repeat-containing protein 1-like n=1 Tax=Physella acuta TaxID=109671 RepID=UPI0027DE4923|nr:HEAT repeat-containing protein 1-like [Physella acuta]